MIHHISVQVADVARSRRFYEELLAPLGLRPAYVEGTTIGFADDRGAPFWILPAARSECRELHVAFSAADQSVVGRFHDAAQRLGTEILHAPRLFPEYGPGYYACFVRDPDGHNIEAVWRPSATDDPSGAEGSTM